MDVVGEGRSLPVIFFNGVTEEKVKGKVRFHHLRGVDKLKQEVSGMTRTSENSILIYVDGLASSPECRPRFPVERQVEYDRLHDYDMTGCSIFVMPKSFIPSVGTVFNPYAYFGDFIFYFPNRTPPENDVPPPPDHPDSNLNDSNNDTPTQDQDVASGSSQNNQEADAVQQVSLGPVSVGTMFNPYTYFGDILFYFPNGTPPENDVPPPPDHTDSNLNGAQVSGSSSSANQSNDISNVQRENNDTPTQDQNVIIGQTNPNMPAWNVPRDLSTWIDVREVPLPVPVIFFDGVREVNVHRTIGIHSLLNLETFRELVSQMTNTLPQRDSILIYIDGLVTSPDERLRFRITRQEHLGLLARSRNPGCSILVMLPSLRASVGTHAAGDVLLDLPTPHVPTATEDQNVEQMPTNLCPECEEATRNGTTAEFHHCTVNDEVIQNFRTKSGPIARPR